MRARSAVRPSRRERLPGIRARRARIAIAAAAVTLASCASIGPATIPRDQFDYGDAIASSGREQLLNNIIRLRYVEAPVFVNVSSVINQYAIEGQLSAGVGANAGVTGDDTTTIGGGARFSDKPTITYVPVAGRQFSINLLTPIPPESIFALVQAGWPPEIILRMTVRSINGLNNATASPMARADADPRFLELMRRWGRLRDRGAIGLHRVEGEEGSRIVVYQSRREADPVAEDDLRFVREALGLTSETDEYTLRYGRLPEDPGEIVVLTMSILELMSELAWRADVPADHLESGRTGPSFVDRTEPPLIRVHCSEDEPELGFVSIRNREHWFYVDDRDIASKRTFALLQILLSLTESGEPGAGPVVTIGG